MAQRTQLNPDLPANYFRKYDETPDDEFYRSARLVVHIDDPAIAAATALFRELLPPGGAILDLMSSWRSHLPADVAYSRVAGQGMNATELKQNPQLTDYIVQNLNQNPALPYKDEEFDGCVVTVSVQYLTQPVAVFQEVARVLKPGAPFITVFSNRMFPTKAVAVWQALDDAGHAQLVETYYEQTGLFTDIHTEDRSPNPHRSDPLFATIGYRK
ncbi:methyltransferase domain-containing protein [Fibrella forsythiae]|uniref:Methyltransferase domain-containing protein n=1 Tax=Fibrella forsythiae TaxID=2817061 RepID=A0ABS3JQR8_9BACT|nr:methyltransferase domain-containing protein [Fibrella forsythiae]MBO0951793.1 methyltransferase domain-containing protein [Fibrella forsythiae]